jgi:hypothetical protein
VIHMYTRLYNHMFSYKLNDQKVNVKATNGYISSNRLNTRKWPNIGSLVYGKPKTGIGATVLGFLWFTRKTFVPPFDVEVVLQS